MVLLTITRQLRRLRRRERLVRLAWGAARWLAVVVVALAVACLIDWWIDRRQDTPFALRVGLLAAQVALAAALAVMWIITPLVRRRRDDDLALFVEEKVPDLHHRLISAVQLNRPNADTAGMSPGLIAVVTREAAEQTAHADFASLVDHTPLQYAAGVMIGVAAFAGLAFAVAPELVSALLARQLLSERDIPRWVALENRAAEVCPSGEPVTVKLGFRNRSEVDHPAGSVRVTYADGTSERFPLTGDPYGGVTCAQVPAGTQDFTFLAWLGDGRLRQPGRVRRVPRPAVVEQLAWVQLPPHCGTRPDGKPYEQPQPRGEVVGLPGSSARAAVRCNKPVAKAAVELLGTPTAAEASQGARADAVLRTVPLTLADGGTTAEGTFDLRPAETAYRVVLADEHGFANLDPPRRGLRIVPEEAPQVALLPEQFLPEQLALIGRGAAEDFEVEGVPIPLGGSIRIAYTASHPYGLGAAKLFYRINEGPWWPYPLAEVPATEATGPFDPRRGAFVQSRPGDQVQFHAASSPEPLRLPARLDGGGRFDFQTRGLPELKVGDHVEFFVEVTNREPVTPKAGRSEVRLKSVVTVPQLVQWIDATLRQEDRIRQLEQRQRGVFGN
jgi:hypothetical protein